MKKVLAVVVIIVIVILILFGCGKGIGFGKGIGNGSGNGQNDGDTTLQSESQENIDIDKENKETEETEETTIKVSVVGNEYFYENERIELEELLSQIKGGTIVEIKDDNASLKAYSKLIDRLKESDITIVEK